jgi:hypothetical protein
MKNLKFKHWFNWLFAMGILLLVGCSDRETGSGELSIEITDAPVDDADVSAVFVTITDVKIDGKSFPGFSGKQTINLLAYQEGKTKLLGSSTLDAKSYSNITLVLDTEMDANGNVPGCYVVKAGQQKQKLSAAASGLLEVTASKGFNVAQNASSSIVIDFDLRKAISRSSEATSKYKFATQSELNSAIRVVAKSKSGHIKGSYQNDSGSQADKVVVYVYKKGTFNLNTETSPHGASGVLFAKAVSSTTVNTGLTGTQYKLAFLEEGEYEVYFVTYNKNASGEFNFAAVMQAETKINGSVSNFITVSAGAEVSISAILKGFMS